MISDFTNLDCGELPLVKQPKGRAEIELRPGAPVEASGRHPPSTGNDPIFLQEFCWSGERKFLESLSRFACGDALLKLSSTRSPRRLNFAKIGSMGWGAADGIKNGGIDC